VDEPDRDGSTGAARLFTKRAQGFGLALRLASLDIVRNGVRIQLLAGGRWPIWSYRFGRS
jgi:hypothetical protein